MKDSELGVVGWSSCARTRQFGSPIIQVEKKRRRKKPHKTKIFDRVENLTRQVRDGVCVETYGKEIGK